MFQVSIVLSNFSDCITAWEALDFRRSKSLPDGNWISGRTGETRNSAPCTEAYAREINEKCVRGCGYDSTLEPTVSLDARKVPGQYLRITGTDRVDLVQDIPAAEIFQLIELAGDWTRGLLTW